MISEQIVQVDNPSYSFVVLMYNECMYCGSTKPGEHLCKAVRNELNKMIKGRVRAMKRRGVKVVPIYHDKRIK